MNDNNRKPKAKFYGTIEDLSAIVSATGRIIKSCTRHQNMWQIKTEDLVVINLYRTNTLQLQGNDAAKKRFELDYAQYIETQ